MAGVGAAHKIAELDSSCRLLIVPLFRGNSRCESLILSHHFRFNVTCERYKEEFNDDEDDDGRHRPRGRAPALVLRLRC